MKISEYQTNCHAEAVRLANAKTAIATAIEGKGVTVPDGTLLDGMAALIESIETGGGTAYTIGHGLKLDAETNTLSVDTADKMEQDNTLPITSAAVYVEVGNINALLKTI